MVTYPCLQNFRVGRKYTTSKMYDPLPVLEGAMQNPLPWLETMKYTNLINSQKRVVSLIRGTLFRKLSLFSIYLNSLTNILLFRENGCNHPVDYRLTCFIPLEIRSSYTWAEIIGGGGITGHSWGLLHEPHLGTSVLILCIFEDL